MTARSKGLPKISLILVLAAGMCPSSHAAELTTVPAESSFFDAIAGMVNWFSDLSAKIEHLKTSADRKQLIVRVRRIHEALVNLEQDKQTLADSIAESNPNIQYLQDTVRELHQDVDRLKTKVRELTVALREEDARGGWDVERKLDEALRERKEVVLKYLEQALSTGTLDRAKAADEIAEAIKALRKADKAVTTFLDKLKSD